MTPRQPRILNTKGAAERLSVSINWIHKLVERGRLSAHVYDERGELVKRSPGEKRQGQGLFFTEADVRAYQARRRRQGRPYGARDSRKRVSKTTIELAQEVPKNT